jgi:hypothetical protein
MADVNIPPWAVKVAAEMDPNIPPWAVPADKSRVGAAPAKNRNRDWARGGFSAIPAAAALAGALTPAGPAGMVTGGILGKGLQEYALQFVPGAAEYLGENAHTPEEQAFNLGREGIAQVGNVGAGQLLSGVSRAAGRGLMRASVPRAAALEESFGLADEALSGGRASYGPQTPKAPPRTIVDVLERERIGAGKGIVERAKGKPQGSKRMEARAFSSGEELKALLDEAEARGWRTTAKKMTAKAAELAKNKEYLSEFPEDAKKLSRLIKAFRGKRSEVVDIPTGAPRPKAQSGPKFVIGPGGTLVPAPAPATPALPTVPVRVYYPVGASVGGKIERGAAKNASKLYQNPYPSPAQDLRGQYSKAVADQFREEASATIPGFQQINDRTRQLLAAEEALRAAEMVRSTSTLDAIPGAVKLATPAFARARPFVNRVGLSMTNPHLLEALQLMPIFAQYGMFPDGFGSDTTNSGGR